MTAPLPIRPMKQSDRAFVEGAWLRTFEGAPAVRGADREHYKTEMLRAIRRLLDRATVRVACDPLEEDSIVGWAAYTGREFHYGLVKDTFRSHCDLAYILAGVDLDAYTFRGRHIEHALVGVSGCEYTPDGEHFKWTPPKGWRFTPRFTI